MELREDTLFYPLLVTLAGCLCTELEQAGLETCFCGVTSGASVDISRVSPENGGMGWVRLASIVPSMQQAASGGAGGLNLCTPQLSAQIEVGYADCYPIDADGLALSLEDELDAVRRHMAGAQAAYRAAFCCDWLRNSKRRLSQGSWAPGGPEGGVLWSTWTMSVEVP